MQKIAIETRGLTRRFGTQLAVNSVDLRVPEAGVYGFLGPNGAGKTTTIRMLLGLIRPNAGEVRLFGESLAEHHLLLMQRVGALVETPSLYSHLTGRENLEVTRRLIGAKRELIDRALGIVKLTADAHRRVREYSLGMRQRLSLALALLNNPALLILDEPANGLDPAGIHEMRDLIRRLPTEFGITVFLSSHLLSEVEQVANHIGIIHQGKLIFQGTLADLQAERHEHLTIGATQPDKAANCLLAAGWSVLRREDGLLTVAAATRDAAASINTLLVGRQLEVFHIAMAQASLEDIFLNLTTPTEKRKAA
ncbi:MAG TPA: ATP-binding cassette domain-containing protein [Blastocatellia bacterium]|nr:ATP-binding cassette domain-containing protein [Blastocatellia bacterium]HMV83612.1 ATP-binding cassette domain-containing protein [Blastocatellia bacterium]HMX28751.1 ATP-binding cassette domain-containing protein [Blastocatellia bacterium]HMY72794.1 ATP-binding cassette domain-containing protein [Blastocatellia bacterium]HMZ22766.1 ATP-binding cassette domain-containing protein [Blastocatellia bacterium]